MTPINQSIFSLSCNEESTRGLNPMTIRNLMKLALNVLLMMLYTFAANGQGVSVSRYDCFPVEKLPPELQKKAEQLLLKLMDSEALYTVIGSLKPISSSFWTGSFSVTQPELSSIRETRKILDAFQCGEAFESEVLVFQAVTGGKRHAHAWIANRKSLRTMVEKHSSFYDAYGLTPETRAMTIVEKMEHADRSDRLRASGYQFGYPDYAVDFFVEAEKSRLSSKDTKLIPRDFFSVATHVSQTNRFVWAIPKGSSPRSEDIEIKAQAELILSEYKKRRELYIGEGKPGIVALIRDWFDNGQGECRPENAMLGLFPTQVASHSTGSHVIDQSSLISVHDINLVDQRLSLLNRTLTVVPNQSRIFRCGKQILYFSNQKVFKGNTHRMKSH